MDVGPRPASLVGVAVACGVVVELLVGRGVALGAGVGRGVLVTVGVKVGNPVGVWVGIEVDTRDIGLRSNRFVKRQACRKASRPRKPDPFIKFRLSINSFYQNLADI